MPLLERIADMGPDAMETLTPPGMGGDVDLAEAKRRVGERVCLVGGWDQFHFSRAARPPKRGRGAPLLCSRRRGRWLYPLTL